MSFKELPIELQNRLKYQLGDEIDAFSMSMNSSHPLSIRLNPFKPVTAFDSLPEIPWCPQGRYLEKRPIFPLDPHFHAGAYYVQEASSMFLAHVLHSVVDLHQNIRVLDLAASPGGKSTLIQSLISRESLLVANEVIRSRVSTLIQNMVRWGGTNFMVTHNDPRHFSRLPELFDVVLVDAPCSGEGLFRREPELVHEWSEKNVKHCSVRQRRILGDVVGTLRPGGILIYSTCTYSEQENEENLKWLLDQGNFQGLELEIPSDWNIVRSHANRSNNHAYGYRFYPHRVRGEGFFIAALRKNPDRNANRPYSHTAKVRRIKSMEHVPPGVTELLEHPSEFHYLQKNEHIFAVPGNLINDYDTIRQVLRVQSAGIYLGKLSRENFIPSAELGLSTALNKDIPRVELELDNSLAFLSKQTLAASYFPRPGRYLVSYNGVNLGWMKVLANGQTKNYFPTKWRLTQRRFRSN